jgi:hypothetical protein
MNGFQTAPLYMTPAAPAAEPGVKPTLYNPRDAEKQSRQAG